jgi:Zn-finger protein
MRLWLMLLPLMMWAAEPFNHAQHGPLKRPCTTCHAGAETKSKAGRPVAAACQTCHVEKVPETVPMERVYRVPDFVFFSHARHKGAGCASCHGDMNRTAKVDAPHRGLKMKDCMDCHKEHRATLACTACHELGQ